MNLLVIYAAFPMSRTAYRIFVKHVRLLWQLMNKYSYTISKSLIANYWMAQVFRDDCLVFVMEDCPNENEARAFCMGFLMGARVLKDAYEH